MDDDWMTEALQRADERHARDRAEREAAAARFSAIFWPVFFAVALGVPVGLWIHGLDLGGLAAATWQMLLARLGG